MALKRRLSGQFCKGDRSLETLNSEVGASRYQRNSAIVECSFLAVVGGSRRCVHQPGPSRLRFGSGLATGGFSARAVVSAGVVVKVAELVGGAMYPWSVSLSFHSVYLGPSSA